MEHINNVMKYSSAILRVSLIRTESIFKSTSVAAPFRTSNRNAVRSTYVSMAFVYICLHGIFSSVNRIVYLNSSACGSRALLDDIAGYLNSRCSAHTKKSPCLLCW